METPAEVPLLQQVLPHRGIVVEIGPQTGAWIRQVRELRPSITGLAPDPRTVGDKMSFDRWAVGQTIGRIACLRISPPSAAATLLCQFPDLLQHRRIDAVRFSGDATDAGSRVAAALQRLGYALFRLEARGPVRLQTLPPGQAGEFFAMAPRFLPDPATGRATLDMPALLARHQIKPRGVIHIGAHTCQELPLYRALGVPRIVFIEANPGICEKMRAELAAESAVRIENFAVAETDGTLTLRLMTESQSSSILPLKHHREYYPEIRQEGQIDVPARRLDTLFRELSLSPADFNFLHMDIQGAEMLALRGAISLLAHFDAISLELNFDELYEGCAPAEEIEDFLRPHGFQLAEVRCPCSPSWGDALFVRVPPTPPQTRVQLHGRLRTGAPIISFRPSTTPASAPPPPPAAPGLKVALLYSGLVRTLARTWPSVQRHLGPYRPDIYYYLNEPEQADFVERLLHPTRLLVEPDPTLPEYDYARRLGPGVRKLQNDLRQLHGLARVNQLCRSTGIAYDWVFRIRADVEIVRGPEPLQNLDPSFIYIPKSNNWYGYSDRIGFGTPGLMSLYMERYAELHAFMQEGGIFQMEIFLAHCLRKHRIHIARTNLSVDLLRPDGTRVTPSQSLSWNDVP